MFDIFNFDLQLFAEPGEKEEDQEQEEETVTEEEEQQEEEPAEEEESVEEEEQPAKKDKKTAAIVREKRENKLLKQKIADLEREKAEREREKSYDSYRKSLSDKGFSDEEIEDKVTIRREIDENKRELQQQKYERQADKLSSKYPDVHDYLPEFIKIVEASKGAITLEEVCKAKLNDSTEHEIREKAEQEALINRQKAVSKKTVVGDQKKTTGVKFSAEDEAAYQFYLSRNPGASRAKYNEILKIRKG